MGAQRLNLDRYSRQRMPYREDVVTIIYELVKYRYGVAKYTGPCLTPKLGKKVTSIVHGVEMTATNEGPGSLRAEHFQRPETAQAWMRDNHVQVRKPDWTPLPGGGYFPPS